MSFRIPSRSYRFDEFIDLVLAQELPSFARFKVGCYLTRWSSWEEKAPSLEMILEKNGIRVEDLGEIKRLVASYRDRITKDTVTAVFYAYLSPETKLLICITDEKAEAFEETLDNVSRYSTGFYHMFIGNSTFNYISHKIVEMDPQNQCTYFSARYLPSLMKKSEFRPDRRRTLVYYAPDGDGLEALKELRQFYGVLPRVMRFRLIDLGIFEIKSTGLFTLWSEGGTLEARKKLLDLASMTLENVLKIRKIIETSEYKLVPVKTDERIFEVPRLTPWIINFSKSLNDEQIGLLFEILDAEDFTLFNYGKATENSFRVNGMVIDRNKHNLFTIDISNRQIIVAPYGEMVFDSFLRFYQMVVERLDPESEIKEFEEN